MNVKKGHAICQKIKMKGSSGFSVCNYGCSKMYVRIDKEKKTHLLSGSGSEWEGLGIRWTGT